MPSDQITRRIVAPCEQIPKTHPPSVLSVAIGRHQLSGFKALTLGISFNDHCRYTKPAMNAPKRKQPASPLEQSLVKMRLEIASNLQIDPERIKYASLGRQCRIGITGERWLIFYRDEWRELPWHFDGALNVTREMVRKWHGAAE